MYLQSVPKRPTSRSGHRLLLRTAEIARLLQVKEAPVRQMVWRGDLPFTGDPVQDFLMLVRVVEERER